jgi:chromosome segregation ATPase
MMTQSLSQVAGDLTALASRLHQLAEAELQALRAELQQESRARQEAVARAETLEQELALLEEKNQHECLQLRGELEREQQGRERAEAELASIHKAIVEQIALGDAQEAASKAAEQEREQRLQQQIQALHQQLDQEIQSRTKIEATLRGVRQAFFNLLVPIEPEAPLEQSGFLERLQHLEART